MAVSGQFLLQTAPCHAPYPPTIAFAPPSVPPSTRSVRSFAGHPIFSRASSVFSVQPQRLYTLRRSASRDLKARSVFSLWNVWAAS